MMSPRKKETFPHNALAKGLRKLTPILCILTCLLQSGCMMLVHLSNGIDAAIPRPVEEEPGFFRFILTYEDQESIFVDLNCEKYYEAQASTRGNYWTWREVGRDHLYEKIELVLEDEKYGRVQFTFPTCADMMTGRPVREAFYQIWIDEKIYLHVESEGSNHVYRVPPYIPADVPEVTIRYELEAYHLSGLGDVSPVPTYAEPDSLR